MKNKFVFAILILALVCPIAVFAAGQKDSAAGSIAKPKVTLWTTGSDNVRQLFEKLIADYNARPESTSVMELQFLLTGSGDQRMADRLAAAKLAGKTNTDFDLIAENGASLSEYVEKANGDIFVPLDFSKIPNYKNLKMKSGFYTKYVVPYRGTTVIMAYDSIRLPNPPKTFEALEAWIKANPGRFAYNPPGTGGAGAAFVNLALYRTLPDAAKVSTDEKLVEQWKPGWDWLASIHPYLYKSGGKVVYPNKNQGSLDLLINKEVDLIPAWADQALTNMSQGVLPESTNIYQLSPALSGTDVVLAVPNIGGGADKCYDFINYMISPAAQKLCLETIFAVPVIDTSLIDSSFKKMVKDLDVSGFTVISQGKLSDVRNQTWDATIARLP
ncbi:hypothetical protein MASR2M78_37070 [Treponema sp.]